MLQMMVQLDSMMLPELQSAMMARDVLTRLRWLRRQSMMMLFSVTIVMTEDATQLMLLNIKGKIHQSVDIKVDLIFQAASRRM